jgi:hypothetical protein
VGGVGPHAHLPRHPPPHTQPLAAARRPSLARQPRFASVSSPSLSPLCLPLPTSHFLLPFSLNPLPPSPLSLSPSPFFSLSDYYHLLANPAHRHRQASRWSRALRAPARPPPSSASSTPSTSESTTATTNAQVHAHARPNRALLLQCPSPTADLSIPATPSYQRAGMPEPSFDKAYFVTHSSPSAPHATVPRCM